MSLENCEQTPYDNYNQCAEECMKTDYDCEKKKDHNRKYFCCLADDSPLNVKLVDYSGVELGVCVFFIVVLAIITAILAFCVIKRKSETIKRLK